MMPLSNDMLANVPWPPVFYWDLSEFCGLEIGHVGTAKSWRGGGGNLREEKLPKVPPCGEY